MKLNLQYFGDGDNATDTATTAPVDGVTETPEATDSNDNSTDSGVDDVQAKIDKAVQERLARERKKLPSKEEMQAFNDWKASQQTEAERQEERDRKYQEMEQKNRNLEIKAAALEAGIPKSLLKYAMVDIGEAEDIESGIAAFIQSEMFKSSKQVAHDLGANTKPTQIQNATQEKEKILAAAKAAMGVK